MVDELESLHQQALSEIESSSDLETLNNVRNTYLSKKSPLMAMMSKMKELQGEEKISFGQKINSIKNELTLKLEEKRTLLEEAKLQQKLQDEVIDIITDYADAGELSCSTVGGKVSITIPISVPQMPDKDYDITFDYKYEIGDQIPPTCTITVSGTTITATFEDNDGGSGIKGEDTKTATINAAKDYTFTAEDNAGNSKSCSLSVINTNYKDEYTETDPSTTYSGSCYCCKGQGGTTVGKYVRCNSSGTCSCPPGSSICQRGCKPIYYCSSDASLIEGKCYKKTGVSYYCTAGYTKASDDYCYKINK